MGQRRDITSPHESSMGVAGMPLLPVFRPPCVANVLTRSQILARLLRARENAHDNARSLSKGGRPMVDERPQLAASEIEAELLVELQKLPTLHDTQSVTIRPFSGPQGWTWELDSIEPEVGPEQSKFADVTNVVARLQQQFDLDPSA
jgi:hypothetical protein